VTEMMEAVAGYMKDGGWVMPPLAAGTCMLWYALGLRVLALRRGPMHSVGWLVQRYRESEAKVYGGVLGQAALVAVRTAKLERRQLRAALDDALSPIEHGMRRGRSLIQSLVAAAPLAGLLGTVTGMIDTFDALGSSELYSQSGGGIAGGISQALLTTQLGLAIAVPGVIMGKLLDRRQAKLEDEIEGLKNLLCAHGSPS
jgi:biopolymer transport protein ExbB